MTQMRLWPDSLYVFGFPLSCFLPDDLPRLARSAQDRASSTRM
jgi:hypothetical protein